jgi:tryptophanyl-tRNA synthetase
VDEAVAVATKMSKEDEASEIKFRALEKEFRKKVGLDKDD